MVFYPPNLGRARAGPPQTDADGNMTAYVQDPTPVEMTTCDPDWT